MDSCALSKSTVERRKTKPCTASCPPSKLGSSFRASQQWSVQDGCRRQALVYGEPEGCKGGIECPPTLLRISLRCVKQQRSHIVKLSTAAELAFCKRCLKVRYGTRAIPSATSTKQTTTLLSPKRGATYSHRPILSREEVLEILAPLNRHQFRRLQSYSKFRYRLSNLLQLLPRRQLK